VAHPLLALAQEPATPQALLASTLSTMNASSTQNITLSGRAEFIAGSTDQTGSFTGQCAVSGTSQLQLHLPAMSVTENRQITNGIPSGNWIDSQGMQHVEAGQNLFTPPSWFCPAIALSQSVQSTATTVQFVGNETKAGIAVAHFTILTPTAATLPQNALLTHLTQTDIFLNSQTLMPVALDFNIHPDKTAAIDIPVEIIYSNYSNTSGVWMPYTVQKYVNSVLALTLQVHSASAAPAAQ
jgi:hypothetical protein